MRFGNKVSLWTVGFALLFGGAPAARAVESLPVDGFTFRYGLTHPRLPALESLNAVVVPLGQYEGVLTVRPGSEGKGLTIGAIPSGARFDAAGLRFVAEQLVNHYNRLGFYGVWVAYEGIDLTTRGLVDRRSPDNRTLSVVIWASQVAEARTLARGRRFPAAEANANPKHRWILERSPLRPPPTPGAPGDLFERDRLEGYLRALSADSNRRVEASIASAGSPGLIVLDYLVTEAKSWQVFSQLSNTGTQATSIWRARVGFQHNQLTNHDDVFNLDVLSTPDFGNRAAFMSYRRPLIRPGTLTARVYGSFGDFAADGRAFENLRFVGDNWLAGAEVTYRRDLSKSWELSTALGANYSRYSVATTVGSTAITEGESPFLVPFLSLGATRDQETGSLSLGFRLEHSLNGFANMESGRGFDSLGRIGATAEWTSLRWQVGYQTFLERWLHREAGWESQLHELNLRARGRILFGGGRLIPQEQDLVGGAFSVRGYPESAVSADEMMLFTAEYGFHFPRSLTPGPAGRLFGQPMHWRPAQVLRNPDWDLIGRGFVDYARREVTPEEGAAPPAPGKALPLAERNADLLGAGVGVEFVLKQMLSIRCDLGMVLQALEDEDRVVAKTGDVRAHVVASFSW
ncbi:MAG: ShlB/FhaC/HecB family hemolysin secretion/activation protein [Opitutaceae bacterium]|nr:ShlB/FhaC/HecB family hemolysin secretion/activation protein [Opitutaceae bacterium]